MQPKTSEEIGTSVAIILLLPDFLAILKLPHIGS